MTYCKRYHKIIFTILKFYLYNKTHCISQISIWRIIRLLPFILVHFFQSCNQIVGWIECSYWIVTNKAPGCFLESLQCTFFTEVMFTPKNISHTDKNIFRQFYRNAGQIEGHRLLRIKKDYPFGIRGSWSAKKNLLKMFIPYYYY